MNSQGKISQPIPAGGNSGKEANLHLLRLEAILMQNNANPQPDAGGTELLTMHARNAVESVVREEFVVSINRLFDFETCRDDVCEGKKCQHVRFPRIEIFARIQFRDPASSKDQRLTLDFEKICVLSARPEFCNRTARSFCQGNDIRTSAVYAAEFISLDRCILPERTILSIGQVGAQIRCDITLDQCITTSWCP